MRDLEIGERYWCVTSSYHVKPSSTAEYESAGGGGRKWGTRGRRANQQCSPRIVCNWKFRCAPDLIVSVESQRGFHRNNTINGSWFQPQKSLYVPYWYLCILDNILGTEANVLN